MQKNLLNIRDVFRNLLQINSFSFALASLTLFWAVLLILVLVKTVPISDDLWFAEHTRALPILDWVIYRWETWSSRIAPEALLWIFAPENRSFWVLTSGVFYLTYVFILYKFFLLFRPGATKKQRFIAHLIICSSIWLLASTVFTEAFLWLTGSINYFWMGTLFLIGIYTPVYILVKKSPPPLRYVITSLVATCIVSISQEQFGLSLASLNLVILCIYFTSQKGKTKAKDKNAVILFVAAILSIGLLLASVNAPGNSIRLEDETARWQPDISNVSIQTRAESNIRWFVERLINNSGMILMGLWLLLAITLKSKYPRMAVCFALASLLVALNSFSSLKLALGSIISTRPVEYLFEFHASWGFQGSLISWLPVVFWISILGFTLVGVHLQLKNNKELRVFAVSLLILAAASLAALWLSPTMYASGYRVVYASNLMILVVCIILFSQINFNKSALSNLKN